MQTIDFTDVRDALLDGHFDSELGRLSDLIKARRDLMSMKLMATIRPGDKVKIKSISPKKLIGEIATVVSTNQKTLTVTIDNAALLGPRYLGKCRIPVSCAEALNG